MDYDGFSLWSSGQILKLILYRVRVALMTSLTVAVLLFWSTRSLVRRSLISFSVFSFSNLVEIQDRRETERITRVKYSRIPFQVFLIQLSALQLTIKCIYHCIFCPLYLYINFDLVLS